ncbi:hypothetical protein [Phocoenobacter skyensis]|nr:hypothetical protein [Pasteurella skyensis]MDP8184424.1 hypothetical protein [Pasteurella skyensis]
MFQEGIKHLTLGLHTVGKIKVDYINNLIEVQIASYQDRKAWYEDRAEVLTPLDIEYQIEDFDVDPNLIALRQLVLNPESIFYRKEIQKCHDMSYFYIPNEVFNNESLSIQQ